jgi:two-component system, chemotaxis family, CheB/CheR fusion protein
MPSKKAGAAPQRSRSGTRRPQAERAPVPYIVGIGASAGGFDALTKFLRAMPADSGMAFIIIQHMSPSPRSLSAELFSHHTAMPVRIAAEGMMILANEVYTAPADRDVHIAAGCIHLSKPKEGRGHRLPVDHLFRSLAHDQTERAVGIILSGTGSDGTLGAREIVTNGGIVIVQAPESAQYDGMPRSAIATGGVTHTLTIAKMPRVLLAHSRRAQAGKPVTRIAHSAPGGVTSQILDLLHMRQGQSFAGYKAGMLNRRIERRMGLLSISRTPDYLKQLQRDPQELASLRKDLLIGVTEFFRDAGAWSALEKHVLRPLVAKTKNGEPVRAWVAGAGTGEEAYSLAMLLLEQLRQQKKRCPVHIFATDTNQEALNYGRAGVYPDRITAQVRPAYLKRYFSKIDGHYQVSTMLRESVIFGAHNLLTDPPFSRLNLVTCRNLLIYLEPEVQRRLLLLYHFALRADGHLFLGTAETIGVHEKLYRPVVRRWRIYQRTGRTPQEQIMWQSERRNFDPSASGAPTPAGRAVPAADVVSVIRNTLLDHFAPAAVLVDANMEALYYSGPVDRFLLQRHGQATANLAPLLSQELRLQLPPAIRRAQKTRAPVLINTTAGRGDTAHGDIRIQVLPVLSERGQRESPRFLITFHEDARSAKGRTSTIREGSKGQSKLHHELRATQQDRQNIVEQLATSNEELRASHEEIMSINEELQSMNEELGSSKEELQSVNEELNTVNLQLQQKIGELEVSNNDLRNLLTASDVATLCLDRALRIKWFTPAMQRLFHLLQTDIGRPAQDLNVIAVDPTLTEDARSVLKALTPQSKEIAHHGIHLRRVIPYRTEDERIEGVVITFADITEAKQATQRELETNVAKNEQLEQRVRERSEQLARLSRELTLAELRERQEIARDLHDGLGQKLNVMGIRLDELRGNSDGASLTAGLEEIAILLQDVVSQTRSLTAQLNPPVLDQLGLLPAIEWLGDEMQKHYHLRVKIQAEDEESTSLNQVTASIVYRAIRELLINVGRHGKVKQVRVGIRRSDGRLRIEVRDHGVGFIINDSNSAGLGLATIRERISYIGGVFQIDSKRGRGTSAIIDVPMDPA